MSDDYIKGIDVSSVQGTNIDWNAVAASGIQFSFMKCGNGNDGFDPTYSNNIDAANAAGIKTASYHFTYPLPNSPGHPNRDPVEQATLHFNHCKTSVVAIDLEWPATQDWAKWGVDAQFINDWCLKYLETYSDLAARMPLVYTYPYWSKAVNFSQDIARYALWIASYEATPVIPKPWTDFAFWQTSGGGGKLPNGTPVDTNVTRDLSYWNEG